MFIQLFINQSWPRRETNDTAPKPLFYSNSFSYFALTASIIDQLLEVVILV